MDDNKTVNTQRPRPTWLHRVWGLLPTLSVFFLIGLIVILAVQIKSEGKIVKERAKSEMRRDRAKINVVTMQMTPDQLQDKISFPGYVKPWVNLTVVAEVRGNIVEKTVAEGVRVNKGDVIARIDSRDYENAFRSAKASFEVAEANQHRLNSLFKNNAATQAQIDDIVAAVRTSRAAYDNAKLSLQRCTIVAPMAGIINRVFVEPGQYMDPSKPVAEILDIDKVKVQVGIPESDVDAVRRLEDFSISVDALDGKVFHGKRYYLSKTTDNFARLYNLEIIVQNPEHTILPDMFTRVDIVKVQVPDGLAVPLYSIIKKNEMDAVFVVSDNMAQLRPVQLGIQDGWRMQVRRGVAAGDQVIVVGQRMIDDGDSVNVIRSVKSMEELVQ